MCVVVTSERSIKISDGMEDPPLNSVDLSVSSNSDKLSNDLNSSSWGNS